jgi:hypothetical protein
MLAEPLTAAIMPLLGAAPHFEHFSPVTVETIEPLSQQNRISAAGSFDHLVRAGEERGWNREAERPRGSEIDDQLEIRRLLDGKLARPRTL